MTDINNRFIKAITDSMKDQEISHCELSRRTKINQPTISRILAGKTKLSIERAVIISKALGCKFRATLIDHTNAVAVCRKHG